MPGIFAVLILFIIFDFSKSANDTDDIGNCATTSITAIDAEPWWQLDLGKNYVIYSLKIFSNQETLTALNQPGAFYIGAAQSFYLEYTAQCENGALEEGRRTSREDLTDSVRKEYAEIRCKEPMIGRYVIVQKKSPCINDGSLCMLSSLPLTLCEIEVLGYRLEFANEGKLINLVESALAHQSSTIQGAELAVDGNKKTNKELRAFSQCALTSGSGRLYEWWQIDLSEPQYVNKVTVYSNPEMSTSLQATFRQDGEIGQYRYSSLSHRIDVNSGFGEVNIRDISTRYVTIHQEAHFFLTLCEVQIWGYLRVNSMVNVALGKPTNQSSVVYNAVSDLAVDGREFTSFYADLRNPIARCTHTAEHGDLYPWWRVDLQLEYIVIKLNIFNRGETLNSRLHDAEIRVGNFDIMDYTNGSSQFVKNALCASFNDRYLPAGRNPVFCNSPVFGKYVSIQIVKLCSLNSCHWSAKERNILTLCEVEVFGDAVMRESLEEKNLAPEKRFVHSLDEDVKFREYKHNSEEDLHPWVMVDLKKADIVHSVNLILDDNSNSGHCPQIQIRIGNYRIYRMYNSKLFTHNVICSEIINGILQHGDNKIRCLQPLIGRYVTVQVTERCDNDNCLLKLNEFLTLREIEVWGFEYHDIKPLINFALNKDTTQSDTYLHGVSSLAVDGVVPLETLKNEMIELCSQTDENKQYPWWQVDMDFIHVVEMVKITLPGNGHNIRFHDVEIRVGMEDIRKQTDDMVFKLNPLCTETEEMIFPEGESSIYCQEPLFGQFVTLQIVDKQYNKDLMADNPNILHLCEVEVWGYWDEDSINFTNVAKLKPSTLSSSDNYGDSSLANDGNIKREDSVMEEEFFSPCFPGSTELKLHDQCNRDTSEFLDCAEIYNSGCTISGVYVISYLDYNFDRKYLKVYCDMTTDGGGWTVFQRRDNSLDLDLKHNFTRHWTDYKKGFGNLCGEFWLGNFHVNRLTSRKEMRIDMETGQNKLYAYFSSFHVEDESKNYLISATYAEGNCGNEWKTLNGLQFQTYDHSGLGWNSTLNQTGWWRNENTSVNLNGIDGRIMGSLQSGLLILDKSEMKFRPMSFKSTT